MALREVDEAELARLQAVVAVFGELEKDPKYRTELLKMVKDKRPNLAIPEIDVAAPIQNEMAEVRKELAALRHQREAEKAAEEEAKKLQAFEKSWREQQNALLDANYTVEGVERITEFAKKRGIADLEAAAALFDKQNPPQIGQGRASMFDTFKPDTDVGKHFQDLMNSRGQNPAPEAALIAAALAEARAANRRF